MERSSSKKIAFHRVLIERNMFMVGIRLSDFGIRSEQLQEIQLH